LRDRMKVVPSSASWWRNLPECRLHADPKPLAAVAYAAPYGDAAAAIQGQIDGPLRSTLKTREGRKDAVRPRGRRGRGGLRNPEKLPQYIRTRALRVSSQGARRDGCADSSADRPRRRRQRCGAGRIPADWTGQLPDERVVLRHRFSCHRICDPGGRTISAGIRARVSALFGSEVTSSRWDRGSSSAKTKTWEAILDILEKEGVVCGSCEVHRGSRSRTTGLARASLRGCSRRAWSGSHCCLAAGRRSNRTTWGWSKRCALDKRGTSLSDDQLRANVPGRWAPGGCNGRGA